MAVLEEPAVSRSRLDRLLSVSVSSRLHLALVLVGKLKVDPQVVLDLRWVQVDLDARLLDVPGGPVGLPGTVAVLFGWHAAQQRLDARRTPRWPAKGRVFVNACGAPFTAEQADAVLAHHCRQAGLPVIPLSGLRHPSWSGA